MSIEIKRNGWCSTCTGYDNVYDSDKSTCEREGKMSPIQIWVDSPRHRRKIITKKMAAENKLSPHHDLSQNKLVYKWIEWSKYAKTGKTKNWIVPIEIVKRNGGYNTCNGRDK